MALNQMLKCWEYQLAPNELNVMLAIADHANEDGTGAWPSNDRIAWKTGYTVRNVQKIKKKLRDRGVLVRVKKSTRYRPTEYRIDWSKAKKKEPFCNGAQGDAQGRKDDTPENQDVNERARRHEHTDVSGVNVSSSEPSKEPSEEPSESTRARKDPVEIIDDMFTCRLTALQKSEIAQIVTDTDLWRGIVKDLALQGKTHQAAVGWAIKNYKKETTETADGAKPWQGEKPHNYGSWILQNGMQAERWEHGVLARGETKQDLRDYMEESFPHLLNRNEQWLDETETPTWKMEDAEQ